jgi:hypothetical protein
VAAGRQVVRHDVADEIAPCFIDLLGNRHRESCCLAPLCGAPDIGASRQNSKRVAGAGPVLHEPRKGDRCPT